MKTFALLLAATCAAFVASAADSKAFPPLPLAESVRIGSLEISTKNPPAGLAVRDALGLVTVSALDGQIVHRTTSRILETRATITPSGDYLLMFPEGDHYAKSKGEKMNSLLAYRSSDKGRTWQGPTVAFDIPYSQHGFIPLIPRGSKRIYAFGTQPMPGKWTWENGQRENAPIGFRWSDDDGRTWSGVKLIEPVNDPEFRGMSVMRMAETDAGTWLLGSHIADWSVKPFTTRQYLLRSEDQGKTWSVLPGARPNGWFTVGFDRMDEGRPLNLGGGHELFMSRTPQGHLFTAWSEDDGRTWTNPAPSSLVHPDAPPMVFPLSDGKTLIAFHHNKVPRKGAGDLDEKSENMKVRAEIWAATSTDGGHTWSEPRFVFANAAAPNLATGAWNYQCSYLDALTDDGVLHIFLPHRWQQVLHLTIKESALSTLPTQAQLFASREPLPLDTTRSATEIAGKSYDLVVVGGTPGGIACAVRAARDGCTVLLVQHDRHLGGMMSNGLMQWDALYGGHRSPLFTELQQNIEQHYLATYGKDSRDYKIARFSQEHYPLGWVEPHVAEREFNRLVMAEKKLTLLLAHYPTSVARDGALLQSVTLRESSGANEIQVHAAMFADATYEGDLFALAKVPYRVGREARSEFNEPHAGVVFCNIAKGPAPQDAVDGKLNIRPYNSKQGSIDPTSPFTADRAVQAYNYRFCVTKDPANRIMLTAPPPGYNREEYVHYERKGIATNPGPNQKSHMNSPILPGENHDYPEADWPTREKITERHKNFALGLIWFLQNDESVSPASRAKFREWGLPKDEFADHDHIPYEMYVREARRIVGRHVYTEHDNSLASGFARTPLMPDSVAITDWYMDSHSCTTNSRPGFHYDGKLILTEESRPGQIPYRSLLPQGVDNLLVPVCLSATHVAWGAVRLEPVWMQTGEAAGVAAALSLKNKTTPAQLDSDHLVRELCKRQFMVSFFNDVNLASKESWIPAAEYFGTKGFFHDYNARAAEPLKQATGKSWADGLKRLRQGKLDPAAQARTIAEAEAADSKPMTRGEFAALLSPSSEFTSEAATVITRGEAILLLIQSLSAQPNGN